MKSRVLFFIAFFGFIALGSAQFGNPYGNRFGRQRSAIPQADTPEKKPEPLTAEEIVAQQMPNITEAVGLDDFEQAIVSSILTKYVQQRIELEILKLDQDKTREALLKIYENQKAELEQGLPPEKFQLLEDYQKSGYNVKKMKKKQKKKKKKQT